MIITKIWNVSIFDCKIFSTVTVFFAWVREGTRKINNFISNFLRMNILSCMGIYSYVLHSSMSNFSMGIWTDALCRVMHYTIQSRKFRREYHAWLHRFQPSMYYWRESLESGAINKLLKLIPWGFKSEMCRNIFNSKPWLPLYEVKWG